MLGESNSANPVGGAAANEPVGADDQSSAERDAPHSSRFANSRFSELTGLATSVVLHAVVIMVAVAFAYQPLRDRLLSPAAIAEQPTIPVSEFSPDPESGGIPNPGPGDDSSRVPGQLDDPNVTKSDAWTDGDQDIQKTLEMSADNNISSNIIGGGNFSVINAKTGTISDGNGSGKGLINFGPPGGGTPGVKGFMDIDAGGDVRKIVFVTDGTGTMTGLKLALVRSELERTIGQFKPIQEYNVIFFSDGNKVNAVDSKRLLPATPANNHKTFEFLKKFQAVGSTNPLPALDLAFKLKPQVIYLLTDGEFDNLVSYKDVVKKIDELNKDKKVCVNTIMFGDRDPRAEAALEKIAKENGGRQATVKPETLMKK